MASVEKLRGVSHWYYDREQQLINLQQKIRESQTLTYNGGLFNADQSLIVLLQSALLQKIDELIVLDTLDQPIVITNLDEFIKQVWEANQSSLREYQVYVEQINRSRPLKTND
jgi:hypothetical protein